MTLLEFAWKCDWAGEASEETEDSVSVIGNWTQVGVRCLFTAAKLLTAVIIKLSKAAAVISQVQLKQRHIYVLFSAD